MSVGWWERSIKMARRGTFFCPFGWWRIRDPSIFVTWVKWNETCEAFFPTNSTVTVGSLCQHQFRSEFCLSEVYTRLLFQCPLVRHHLLWPLLVLMLQTRLVLDRTFWFWDRRTNAVPLSLLYIVWCCLIIQPATVTPKSASQKTTVSACVFNSGPL